MIPPRFVDAHVHFWDPRRLDYAWLPSVPPLHRPFLPGDLVDAAGTAQAEALVFVECGRQADQSVDEARWITELAVREPRLRAIVAHASLERGAGVETELAALAALPLVKGVRRLLQDEPDDEFCLRPAFVDGIRRLARFGFSSDLCIRHPQLPAVTELVRRCPEVSFVLDHLAKPAIRDRQLDPWRGHLAELARLPNVVCKISGLTTEADPAHWQPADLRPYLQHALECFGFERVLFGGDWPVATLATTYPRWLETIAETFAEATEAQREALFRANARRVYRFAL